MNIHVYMCVTYKISHEYMHEGNDHEILTQYGCYNSKTQYRTYNKMHYVTVPLQWSHSEPAVGCKVH